MPYILPNVSEESKAAAAIFFSAGDWGWPYSAAMAITKTIAANARALMLYWREHGHPERGSPEAIEADGGPPARSVYNLFKGEISPRVSTLEALAEKLAVPVYFLLYPDLNPAFPPSEQLQSDLKHLREELDGLRRRTRWLVQQMQLNGGWDVEAEAEGHSAEPGAGPEIDLPHHGKSGRKSKAARKQRVRK